MKDNEVKCYIINENISIFEYYWFENIKTFQVEISFKEPKKNSVRYILGNFKSMKDAKEYIKRIGA